MASLDEVYKPVRHEEYHCQTCKAIEEMNEE